MTTPKYDFITENQASAKCPHCSKEFALSLLTNEETNESALLCAKHRREIDKRLRGMTSLGGVG